MIAAARVITACVGLTAIGFAPTAGLVVLALVLGAYKLAAWRP